MRTIAEVCDPGEQQFEIKQISTTDPLIIIGASLGVVLCTLKIVEKILDIYAKTLDIRKMKEEAKTKELSKKLIDSIEAEAKEAISKGIKSVIEELKKEYLSKPRDGAREAHLRQMLDKDVDRLATRIDHRVRIEGDVAPIQIEDGQDVPAQIQNQQRAIAEITRITEKVRYFEMVGEPLLQLPPPTTDDDSGAEKNRTEEKKKDKEKP